MVYFRRPQTPFVDQEISQKPQSQWKLVAEGKEEDETTLTADAAQNNASSSSLGLDGSDGGLDNGNNGSSGSVGSGSKFNGNGSASLLEEDPTTTTSTTSPTPTTTSQSFSGDEEASDRIEDPLAAPAPMEETVDTDGHDQDNDDEQDDDAELAQSLERRLQLEIKHHPESVLLCGYFHEEVMDDCLTLSTYLPGVEARELRVYYGEGVLKIAGARALYNLVQRFERSFALDDQLVDTPQIAAILHDGMLLVRVPLVSMPPPPRKIAVVAATPMLMFKDRRDLFCIDIDVPGVKRKDLNVYYSNGLLRLVWEQMEPISNNNNNANATTGTSGTSLNTMSSMKQMRFEREIPINTLQIDTEKMVAYLDRHTKKTGILTIIAPLKFKRSARPIQVQTAKDLQKVESGM